MTGTILATKFNLSHWPQGNVPDAGDDLFLVLNLSGVNQFNVKSLDTMKTG